MGNEVYFSVNPQFDVSLQESKRTITVEPDNVIYKYFPTTTYDISSASFNILPPGPASWMSREIELEFPVQIAISGTTTVSGGNLLSTGFDALRSDALGRCIQNMNILLNSTGLPDQGQYGGSTSYMPDYLIHYKPEFSKKNLLAAKDISTEYSTLTSSSCNPLADLSDFDGNGNSATVKRGAYPVQIITHNATTFVASYKLKTFLHVEGLFGSDQAEALAMTHIQNFAVNLVFNFASQNFWSHATNSPTTITSIVATTNGNPQLNMKFFNSPSPYEGSIDFNWESCQHRLKSNGSSLASGATTQIVSDSLLLKAIPRKVLLYVNEQYSSKTISSTDTFLSINTVSATMNVRDGILSSASQVQLFNIAKTNGSLDNLSEFIGTGTINFQSVGTTGTFLVLEFGPDICVDYPIGRPGAYQISFNINITNNSANTIVNPTLHTVFFFEQICSISPYGEVNFRAGTGESLVELIDNGGSLRKVAYSRRSHMGGGIFDSVWNFIKRGHDYIKEHKIISKGADLISHVLPESVGRTVAKSISIGADALGYGMHKDAHLKKGGKMASIKGKK